MAWLLKAHPHFEKDIKKLSKTDKERLSELILRIKENPNRCVYKEMQKRIKESQVS